MKLNPFNWPLLMTNPHHNPITRYRTYLHFLWNIGHCPRMVPRYFNTLLNSTALLQSIRAGKSWRDIAAQHQPETAAFEERRRAFLRY